MSEIGFDRVISVLQGWLGRKVSVHVENPQNDEIPLSVTGLLTADNGMAEPFDEEQFDFAVGVQGGVTVNRSTFLGASEAEDQIWIEQGPVGNHTLLVIGPMD